MKIDLHLTVDIAAQLLLDIEERISELEMNLAELKKSEQELLTYPEIRLKAKR